MIMRIRKQMFTCKKNRQKVSLVNCTNQTKRLMEKLKRKPLISPESVKAVRWKGWGVYGEKDFQKRYFFNFAWNDGDDGTDELR